MSEENTQLVPCTSCKKPIAPNAAFCSFCGASQKKQKKTLPSQFKLFLMNLVWPGGGDWALGEKARGAIICFIVIGALLAYCGEMMPIVQKAVNMASRGDLSALEKLESQLHDSNNVWCWVFTIGYIFSFLDSFFMRINKQKELDKEGNNDAA